MMGDTGSPTDVRELKVIAVVTPFSCFFQFLQVMSTQSHRASYIFVLIIMFLLILLTYNICYTEHIGYVIISYDFLKKMLITISSTQNITIYIFFFLEKVQFRKRVRELIQ